MKFRVKPSTFLIFVLVGAVVFNIELYNHMQQYAVDSDYSQIETLITQVKANEIQATQERYLRALEHKKLAFESTDTIIIGYEYIFKVIVVFNLLCIASLCGYNWWFMRKQKLENS